MLEALLVVYCLILYQVGVLLFTAGSIILNMTKQERAECLSSNYELSLYIRSRFGKNFAKSNLIGLGIILLCVILDK